MQSPAIVTTSWDDGDSADLKIAELLAEHRLGGTFYVPIKGHHSSTRMSSLELCSLAAMGFEIGAHGVSLPNLTLCTPEELAREVCWCKQQLEDQLGEAVRMFAYPRGRYNRHVISSVKQAGYCGARTTRMLARSIDFDPFQMPTSVQAYPHSTSEYLRNLGRSFSIGRTTVFLTWLQHLSNWVDLGEALFDAVLSEGGVWHLYGHSWEVNDLRLWGALDEIFAYVSMRSGVLYLPNSGVLGVAPQESCPPSLVNISAS